MKALNLLMAGGIAALCGSAALAAPVGPYTPDANTLVLLHLDEAAGGSVTTNIGRLGGNFYSVNFSSATPPLPVVTTMLGATGYSTNSVTFNNCEYNTAAGYLLGYDYNGNGAFDPDPGNGQSPDALPMSNLNIGNGGQTPFSLEALIQPTSTNGNQEIICTDSQASNRAFQFRISGGALMFQFIYGSQVLSAGIPSSGPNAFVAGTWYHVAFTYDGTNGTLYWTRLDPTISAASVLTSGALVLGAADGAVTGPLVIANRSRPTGTETFLGSIDEVRISSVCRAANQMIFSTGPVSASPTVIAAADPVYAGTPVTLSSSVGGAQPISYFWQSDGATGGVHWTNLPNSTNYTYALATIGLAAGTYQYRLVVTNANGAFTNTPGNLNLLAASGPVLVANTVVSPSATYAGGPVSISASFVGTQPIAYQWFFTTNAGSGLISGATNSTYTLASAQTNNTGSYFLMASNNPPGLGSQTLSSTPAALTVLAGSPSPATNASPGMYCELMEHPEQTFVSARTPRFGWNYHPSFRNDAQAGYQIIVASSQALATAGTGDLWDSGLVSNSASINVFYGGAPLQPATNYFWRVRTMDSAGHLGAFSGIQQFNTATQLSDPLTNSGVIYQLPRNKSVNCYPLRFVTAAPVLVTNTAPGDWFIDFGQDAFGYVTVHLNGNLSGTNVQARFGEMATGSAVNTSPPGTVRYGASAFTLQSGNVIYSVRPPSNSGQTISPPSSFGVVLPFRYFELTNLPGSLTLTDVVQQCLVSEFDTNAASFSSSSPALNQVWALCRNSMQWLSFDGIYVDGDRERTPYEADSYIHQMSSYAVDNEFTMPRCSFEYLLSHPTWPTEWKFHMIFVAWADYLQTGNTDLLYKYYTALQPDTFTWAATASGLMQGFPNYPQTTNSDIVDWPAADRDGFVISSGSYLNWTNSVGNAFYYRCLQLMANIATVIGRTNDAATYAADATQVYGAYNAAFWNSGSQSYVDGVGTSHSSAHANFFPLAFGLVPASNQVAVVNYIHSRIAANKGMPPSVYGAQYLLEALFLAGDTDTALGLIATNGPRSWMNMINIGSTLTDEAWSLADKSNEDWNHAWGAAAGNLIARYVLGLQPLTAGFGLVLIQPHLGQTLSYAQGTIPTIRGPVSIQVTNAVSTWQLLLNIPGNVTATVMVPATNTIAILDGAVVSGSLSNNWLTVTNIGSGQHAIWSSAALSPSQTTLYNNWASAWFGTNAANPAIAGQTADADGDGMNNYSEFIAGTDPTNPESRFTVNISAPTPVNYSNFVISVSGQSGRSYTLERSLTLAPTAWSSVFASGILRSNQTLDLVDPSPPPTQAFYKVMVGLP